MTWLLRCLIIACGAAEALLGSAQAAAHQSESCRQTPVQRVCGDSAGSRRAEAQAPANALPPDFRGRILYRGNYRGTLVIAGRPPRRLNLREVFNSASSREDIAGDIEISLDFDGSAVRGAYRPTGRIGRSRLSGTRQGNECRLYDPDGWPWSGRCDRSGFEGAAQSLDGQEPVVRFGFETRTLSFVDTAAEERQRTIARRDAERQQAEAQRRQTARLAAAPAAPARPAARSHARSLSRGSTRPRSAGAYERLLNEVVGADATNWAFRVFRPGSVRVTEVNSGPRARALGVSTIVIGTFNYQGGDEGSVTAHIADGEVRCLEYQDSMFGCQPPREVRVAERPADPFERMRDEARCSSAYSSPAERRRC